MSDVKCQRKVWSIKKVCGHTENEHGKITPFPCDNSFCECEGFDPLPAGVRRENKTITKWADSAMFTAEPIVAEEGPRVYLLSMTPDPLGAIAAAAKMYKGEVVRDLSSVTDAERLEYFEQVQKTKLQAPFEFVKFHFLIEGVTRAFTHQMVRQRTAVYAQESLRFAVKEDMPVGMPPSLAGSRGLSDIQVDVDLGNFDRLSDIDKQRFRWEKAIGQVRVAYEDVVGAGMPAEDARGLLPHNVLTRLHYSTDLRALLDHAGNRLSVQAQFEWRLVFSRIAEAIRGKTVLDIGEQDAGPGDIWAKATAADANGSSHIYMADKIADMFRPVCYQTGKCEFKANFDRACSIRERVDAHHAKGEPSSEWVDIQPWEWLADPGAARR